MDIVFQNGVLLEELLTTHHQAKQDRRRLDIIFGVAAICGQLRRNSICGISVFVITRGIHRRAAQSEPHHHNIISSV